MNTEIEKIFNDFKVDNKVVPVKFLKYKGSSKTYITYQEISNKPELEADDIVLYSASVFDFDVYSDGNYLKIIEELKTIMSANDFIWVEDSQDMFETETGLYHKTITFAKERSVL